MSDEAMLRFVIGGRRDGRPSVVDVRVSTVVWIGLLLFTFLWMYTPYYSVHFAYIPYEDISKELLEIRNNILANLTLPPCEHSVIYNGSVQRIPQDQNDFEFDGEGIEAGQYYPKHCKPRFSTAIIVPYRNRSQNLGVFIPYMHSFLRKQEIHYRIFVVSQNYGGPWNKGKLFNAGVRTVKAMGFQCMVLHDVDMLPLHLSNMYACTSHPRHMSPAIDKYRYALPYDSLVGGALAMTLNNYESLNGFSNKYEMWGGEDDDLAARIRRENLKIQRFPPHISLFTMLSHPHEPINPDRIRLLQDSGARYKEDGLSDLKVKRVTTYYHPLFTNISVEL